MKNYFNTSSKSILLWLALAMSWTLIYLPAQAQFYFGKNKVQYTRFDWHVMTTEHFRIYFYKDEGEIARIAARSAEDSYRTLAARFNHEVKRKVPLIIYSSPSFFSQTNVIPGLLPESVGGFTEFMKGRVVVPFHGSYHDFDHVIRHELVHVFTIDKLDSVLKRRTRAKAFWPPLWFIEGLAECWSKPRDTEADMVVKDMVVNGQLFTIPNLGRIRGTYFMYKLGESICRFIDSAYGQDKLVRLFDNWHKGRDFRQVVKITLGESLEEVSRKWEYSLKKEFYPEMANKGLPKMESRQLTHGGYSVKGAPIRFDMGDGPRDWLVYKANRLGYTGIYMTSMVKGGHHEVHTLVKGDRSSSFESLYLLRSGIDANDSGMIVFSSKSKERDVVYLYDLDKNDVVRRYEFDSLISSQSPRFSHDGRMVTFSGVGKDGFTDIYILHLATGVYERVTRDVYYDQTPTFTRDGKAILFASDRNRHGPSGASNLFRLDLKTGDVSALTSGAYMDRSPEDTEHGIYFSSDRGGTFNLFLLRPDGQLVQQSTLVTGAFDPRLTGNGKKLTYTGYQNMNFQVYLIDVNEAPASVKQPELLAHEPWYPPKTDKSVERTSISYDTDYSFDIAQSSVGYDPVFGSLGGFQGAVSDVLGNRSYYFILTNTAEARDDLLKSFSGGITFVNQERRLNWSLGVFHLYDEYFNDFDGFFTERQAGVSIGFSYPISKFHRLDLSTFGRYSNRDRRFGLPDRRVFLITNYVSWIFDNSLWDVSGPIEGRRYNLSVGVTTAVDRVRAFSRQASADVRHYKRLGRHSAFANRLFAFTSSGFEPQRIYFGGSWNFRGFARRAFYNRNILFASNELRFPLIDQLFIGSPIGGIGFTGIRGALFFDTGSAWDDEFDQFLGSF
ncbi:MAG: hypothetical protein ACE5FH_10745, partial [Candidatus Zixiibacteriota bacterium]